MRERTLAIIKPDAVEAGHVGGILAEIENRGFRIIALRMIHMDKGKAEGFYAVHRERPFFSDLVRFMTSGPAIAMVLEAENGIRALREAMGATDPSRAEEGTIRKRFGSNVERNAIHGSDSAASAAFEIPYLLPEVDASPS